MYQLKGFISILSLIDNTVDVTAPFGELSLWSQTYTRDRGEHENPAIPGYKLSSVYSTDSIVGRVELNTSLANRVLVLGKWIYEYISSEPNLITPENLRDQVNSNFINEVSYFNFGPFVNAGSVTLPEWFSYRNLNFPENNIKVWFSDLAFSSQFDETEIVIIPPIDNLDDFFLSPAHVKALIDARSASRTMELIQSAKNKKPETIIRTETFIYANPDFPNVVFNTNWSVLIYGIAGNNLDSIKDSIVNYVLDHSTHTRTEWAILLPDLFKRTEFVFVPNWFSYAIPNKTVQAGIYSCITDPKISNIYTKTILRQYTSEHIDSKIFYFSYPFKAVAINGVPGPDNKSDKINFSEIFPDFINVNTASTDFNRMSLDTQNWSIIFERLLLTAETMTEFSTIPEGLNRVVRDGFIFASINYQSVQYLVAAKYNLTLLSKYVEDGYVIDGMFAQYLE